MAYPEQILQQMGIMDVTGLQPFCSEEDGAPYEVWQVQLPQRSYVLKKAKGMEAVLYSNYLKGRSGFCPAIYSQYTADGDTWLLMEYVPGNSLCRCDRASLARTLDSLIGMQNATWNESDPLNTFRAALLSRQNRLPYLHEPRLQAAYQAYLDEFQALPRTLCHDDLLPFNVLISQERAVLIDWEVGGILPWPTAFARLIAHTESEDNALFYMEHADKSYAISYFYEHFLKGRGVDYTAYLRSLNLALLHEYCEWVYVGNKFGSTNTDRYRKYLAKAMCLAEDLGYEPYGCTM